MGNLKTKLTDTTRLNEEKTGGIEDLREKLKNAEGELKLNKENMKNMQEKFKQETERIKGELKKMGSQAESLENIANKHLSDENNTFNSMISSTENMEKLF